MKNGASEAPLSGCTVVVTREHRGELGRLLAELGAQVEHVALIAIADADPSDVHRLADALASEPDWVMVTSSAGADRVAAVRELAGTRLAAVGTSSAERLADVAGRRVDLVPSRQLAAVLVDEFAAAVTGPQRIVIAQADRAATTLADGLRDAGHEVHAITAYRTVLRHPASEDRATLAAADVVAFASGSAAISWADALGVEAATSLPPIVAAIGPTTSAAALESGLKVTHESADHSLAGLVETVIHAWRSR